MALPDSVEDICKIVETYGVTDDDVASWVVSLSSFINMLGISLDRVQDQFSELVNQESEAQKYSEECSQIAQEVTSYVKCDDSLRVLKEFLTWECALAADAVKELSAKQDATWKLVRLIRDHYFDLRDYRDLLNRYLAREERKNVDEVEYRNENGDWFNGDQIWGDDEEESEDNGTSNSNQPEGEEEDRDEDEDKKKVEVECSNEEENCAIEEENWGDEEKESEDRTTTTNQSEEANADRDVDEDKKKVKLECSNEEENCAAVEENGDDQEEESKDNRTSNNNQPEGEDADRDEDEDKKKVEVECTNVEYCSYDECDLVYIYLPEDEEKYEEKDEEYENKEEH